MKRPVLLILFILPVCLILAINAPRVFVQKLTLEKGQLPYITTEKKLSAKEYLFTADILETKGDIVSTATHPVNTISIRKAGDGKKLPNSVIAFVHLGNFQNQWQPGQTLHLELTYKPTGKKVVWDVNIPEGSKLINLMNQPKIIPGKAKK